MIVYITSPRKEAKKIAEKLVREKLAVCCNIFPVESIYWWKKKIEKSKESVIIAKTTEKKREKLIKRVSEIHTYKVPAIFSIEGDTTKSYLEYMEESI